MRLTYQPNETNHVDEGFLNEGHAFLRENQPSLLIFSISASAFSFRRLFPFKIPHKGDLAYIRWEKQTNCRSRHPHFAAK